MPVFVSSSGTKSRDAAAALAQFIRDVVPKSQPWIASEIGAGEKWEKEIARQLRRARIGILCLTDENKESPWLLFEAGALARSGEVYLYLVDLALPDIAGPLAQFTATKADQDGTWRLITAINESTGQKLPERALRTKFDKRWPDLREALTVAAAPRVESVAIVFADIVGSTRLFGAGDDLAGQHAFEVFFARGKAFARSHKGDSFTITGDGFLAAFPTPKDAFAFAAELQRSLAERPLVVGGLRVSEPLKIRIGLHHGVVQRIPDSYGQERIVGSPIALAARISSIANPGEIVASNDAFTQLPAEQRRLFTRFEGTRLKGFNPVELARYDPASSRK